MNYTDVYEKGRKGLYRSRNGLILGVCKGIADYLCVSVVWIRIIVLAVFVVTGFVPVTVLYVIAAIAMKPSPIVGATYEAIDSVSLLTPLAATAALLGGTLELVNGGSDGGDAPSGGFDEFEI